MSKFGPWIESEYGYRYRDVYEVTECDEFYCEQCGCCMFCSFDCCEGRGEPSPCYANQYDDEL